MPSCGSSRTHCFPPVRSQLSYYSDRVICTGRNSNDVPIGFCFQRSGRWRFLRQGVSLGRTVRSFRSPPQNANNEKIHCVQTAELPGSVTWTFDDETWALQKAAWHPLQELPALALQLVDLPCWHLHHSNQIDPQAFHTASDFVEVCLRKK